MSGDRTIVITGVGYAGCKIPIPTLEDLYADYGEPPPATRLNPKDGEIVAFAATSYGGFYPEARDSNVRLAARMSAVLGYENLWVLNTLGRMPFPYSVLYAVAGMFRTEKFTGRKADWLLYMDDDVIVQPDCYDVLRKAADPVERPFVATVGLDRNRPFRAAVWEPVGDPATTVAIVKQWVVPDPDGMPEEAKHKLKGNEMWMPASGVHEVNGTGLCAAIFHRSLFDKIPQPWFAVLPGATDVDGRVRHAINTDSWWCRQLVSNGVKVHVTCDTKVIHIGDRLPIGVDTAWALRQFFPRPQ